MSSLNSRLRRLRSVAEGLGSRLRKNLLCRDNLTVAGLNNLSDEWLRILLVSLRLVLLGVVDFVTSDALALVLVPTVRLLVAISFRSRTILIAGAT